MTRRRILLVVLLGLFAGFGFFAYKRSGSSVPREGAETSAAVDAGESAASAAAPAADASGDAGAEQTKFARTLGVVSPHIELLAPGVVANDGMASDGGGDGYGETELDVEFATVDGIKEVRESLARGGDKEDGADVAVVSLPSFVASYEKFRALKPEVFFVTGWSRGREALATSRRDALVDPPDREAHHLRGASREPATFLSLFAMDLAGISLESVELTEDTDEEDTFAAVARSRPELADPPEGYRLLVSTADALGLIPFVAIAPHGFVERHPEALYEWTSGWLDGRDSLDSDVRSAGQLVASEVEHAKPVELIDLLGWIEFASPLDNARAANLSGRSAATLDELFRLTWRVWRGAGILTTPVPKTFPITTEFIMPLVRERGQMPAEAGESRAGTEESSGEPEGDVLVVYRFLEDDLDEEMFVDRVGLLADIFRRSKLRVTVNWNRPKTNDMIEKSLERFDIPEGRLTGGRRVPGRGTASVEIFEIR